MKYSEIIKEMATPSDVHKTRVYYHGTSNTDAAIYIMKNGIQPRSITLTKKDSRAKVNLNPVAGKVYITPDIGYAQIYAIGGDIAGISMNPLNKNNKYGFIAVIDGNRLRDIQPDEDSVGEIIYYAMKNNSSDPFLKRMIYALNTLLTNRQMRAFKEGECLMWAHAGKKLLKKMTDYDKLKFVDLGAHLAHEGSLTPSSLWRIDLNFIPILKKDGSNFFELAERIL